MQHLSENMNIRIRNIKAFFKGFGYAFSGVVNCIRTERNMRFHVGFGAFVLLFMHCFYELEKAEKCLVYLCIALVPALELINTAIENTCDIACNNQKNSRAKTAKDCAAAAVLVVSVFSAVIGISVFWDTAVFDRIFRYFNDKPAMLVLLIVAVVIWLVWVFSAKGKNKESEK